MIRYILSWHQASSQIINIEIQIPEAEAGVLTMQLPAWRPGRYELGNFARNILRVQAYDAQQNPLSIEKSSRETWQILLPARGALTLRYNYYAAILNAGSTYLSDDQLYVNPVNCFLFAKGKEQEPCEIQLILPEGWKIASGLEGGNQAGNILSAPHFDRLADSPFISSPSLKMHSCKIHNLDVYFWFQGECKPDFERIEHDFTRFMNEQILAYSEFPEKEYHFLFQITPHKSYHGVEHENSTVCMIGPSYNVFKEGYDHLLGLSSHEFYHSWNIKKIRPVEMLPYDFARENYFRTGYVAEGVTTYMGDIMLFRANVFSQTQFFECVHEWLNKHFHNYARFNMSVSEASFDMWVDGYDPGVPHRKTSIYNEGALLAMMLDILIIQLSEGKYGLDDVMKSLYINFAKRGIGYSEMDYVNTVEHFAGCSMKPFFEKYVWGIDDFEPLLASTLRHVGLSMHISPSRELYERNYGIKLSEDSGKIAMIAPESPAFFAGMQPGETIATINGMSINSNIRQWFDYFNGDPLHLRTKTADNRVRVFDLPAASANYFPDYSLKVNDELMPSQLKFFERWTKNRLHQ